MQSVIYAATRYGYRVQVLDSGQVVYECSGGNCWKESPTVKERGIPPKQIEYDADLENQVIGA